MATGTLIADAQALAAVRVPRGRLTVAALVTGAAALLVAAAVHVAQLISIFHAVPWIGPLFAADAVASVGLAIALLATRRCVVAAAGAVVSAGALAGLALSTTTGLFGWHEATLRPALVIALTAEAIAVATLAPLALPAPGGRLAVRPRLAAAGGLLGIAALHVVSAPPEWADAPGVFWLFVALAIACGALALRLVRGLDGWAWPAVLALAATPLVGFLVSRTVGLPGATDDIGDWANGPGLAALAIEAALAAASLARIRAPGRRMLAAPT